MISDKEVRMASKYILELNGVNIGYTKFEFADPPMGVVFGKIIFDEIDSPYELFKNHCIKFNVELIADFYKDRLISTYNIPQLKVFLPNGNQLEGWGGAITGMDSDEFQIEFSGVSYEIMRTEFKHHFLKYYGHD